jgi:tetratricopeptide (TPR) repeat protein
MVIDESTLTESDLLRMTDGRFAAGDPNASYELRDMVSVAASYFERGMIDDAEEMLVEALAAGYTRPNAFELRRRILAARGEPDAGAPVGSPNGQTVALNGAVSTGRAAGHAVASALPPAVASTKPQTPSEVRFTIPLPGVDGQLPSLQRLVADAEADLRAGRLESARDATFAALGLAPSFLPLYIRLAELEIALGSEDLAALTTASLRDCLTNWSDDDDWLTLSMRVTLDPHDSDALVRLARVLLAQRGAHRLDPWVPDAIELTIDAEPPVAQELATAYVRMRPGDEHAVRLHLRAVIGAGTDEEIAATVTRDVQASAAADLLVVRSAVAHAEGLDAWFGWLERAVARLLTHPDEVRELPRAFEATRRMLPAPQHALTSAILRVAAGDYAEALRALDIWSEPVRRETSDARMRLVAACARALATRAVAPIESIRELSAAVAQAVVLDVRPFAESSKLFARSIAAEALMQDLVAVARDTNQQEQAIAQLQALRDRLPEHLEIRTGLADLQIAGGRIADGVRELRYVAERYEQTGNLDRMVEAMRHISDAVPQNVEMKLKLIDGYTQRGIPSEAVRELRLLGDLYLRRDRMPDAAAAYIRGAEIASTTGACPDAMDLYERGINADPDNVPTRHSAVAFYIMNGAVDKATEQLREIVRIALASDDPDEAVAALHQIIGLSPADAAAYHRLGEILTSLGEYAQAERVYRRLGVFTPDDPVLAAKQSALAALAAEH